MDFFLRNTDVYSHFKWDIPALFFLIFVFLKLYCNDWIQTMDL